jgi:hypothetical protein
MAERPSPAKPNEWVVPFPKPRGQIADATRFRSTWVTVSLATLRERGLFERYDAALDPAYREPILSTVPGVWLPLDVARAHYAACDTLELPDSELVDIGRSAVRRANATLLSFISRLAQGAGVTPWTVLGYTPRLWSVSNEGGCVAVARLGPKEARIEVVGFPLAAFRYNRIAVRGIVLGCVELFCTRAHVREIPSLCDSRSLGMRASWA